MDLKNNFCYNYFKNKVKNATIEVFNILMEADPDVHLSNCEWIIDQFSDGLFLLEDIETVRNNINQFKKYFGEKRSLPGYERMKQMNREKSGKQYKTKEKIVTKTEFQDCYSYFKNVKKTLPKPYSDYDSKQFQRLFQEINIASLVDSNDNANPSICIWIVNLLKRGDIVQNELPELKNHISKYLKMKGKDEPMPELFPFFPRYSNYQLLTDTLDKNIDLVHTSDKGVLLIPKNVEASCYYGGQTSWCTAQRNDKNMFDKYNKTGNIYIWFDKFLRNKYQFHFEDLQFRDVDDNQILPERMDYFRKHPILRDLFEKQEKIIKTDPDKAFKYSTTIIRQRIPEAEKLIMENQEDAYYYGIQFFGGRWREAEKHYLKDPMKAYNYALEALGQRWPEAEETIMKNPEIAYLYSRDVIGNEWPEAEPYILQEPKYAELYLKNIKKTQSLTKEIKKEKETTVEEFVNEVKKLMEILEDSETYRERRDILNIIYDYYVKNKKILDEYPNFKARALDKITELVDENIENRFLEKYYDLLR